MQAIGNNQSLGWFQIKNRRCGRKEATTLNAVVFIMANERNSRKMKSFFDGAIDAFGDFAIAVRVRMAFDMVV